MRFLPLSFSLLHLQSLASVIPASSGVAVVSTRTSVTLNPNPEWITKDVSIYNPALDIGPQTSKVIMTGLATMSAIVGAACLGGPVSCAIGAVMGSLTTFYTIYKAFAAADKPASPAVRSIDGVEAHVHDLYLPSAEHPTVLDKINQHAVEGQWLTFGNTSINGVTRDMHFMRQGSMLAARSVPRQANKRDDSSDDNGVVATYFWEDNDQKAWNDWNNAQVYPIAEDIGTYMINQKFDIACADIIDQDGPVDVGIMTLADNDSELGLIQSQWDSGMKICKNGET